MRILTLTNLYPNPFQPHRATFNRQQFRHLAERHDVAVIAPILWTDEFKARCEGMTWGPAGRRTFCDGIPVEHPCYLYTPKILRSWYGHFFRWSVGSAFRRALDGFCPDLVYATWAYPDGWAAMKLGRRAGLPVVVKLHGSDILTLCAYPARQRRTEEVLRGADGLVAVSKDIAERVIAFGAAPERVRVVYDGVDSSLFHSGGQKEARRRLGLSSDAAMLLFVGNLVAIKGLDVLLRACELLARDFEYSCFLIGDGPLRGNLERDVARAGLTDRVRFVGPRPHAQLPDWYRAADVFVLPSRSEGVPNVLLEAAACGTPFVASRVGGIPEIAHLGESRLVPPGDVRQLAGALREFLERPAPRPARPATEQRGLAEAAQELANFLGQVRGRK